MTESTEPPPGSSSKATAAMETTGEAIGRSESGIFRVVGQYAVMQGVIALAGLVRNKVVVLRLGPAAFGELSQIAAVSTAVTTMTSFGMGVSLTRNAAAARTFADRQTYLANANGLVVVLSSIALLTTLALLASGELLRLAELPQSHVAQITTALFLLAIPITALQTNYIALLQGLLDIKGLAVQRGVAVLIATAISAPIVWLYGFTGAGIQFLLLGAIVTAMLGWRVFKLGYRPFAVSFDTKTVALLASFGLISVVSGVAQGVSDTAIRAGLIGQSGAAANGLLQAPYMLAMVLKVVLLSSIGTVALATISGTADTIKTTAVIDRILNVVLPLGTLSLGLLGLLGIPAMLVLYSDQFVRAAEYFPYILAADLLLIAVWVIGAPLLATGDRILWLGLDVLYATLRWLVSVSLLPRFGVYAVLIGLVASTAFHLALVFLVFRMRYRLSLHWRHPARLVFGLFAVATLSLVGANGSNSPWIMIMGAVAWVLCCAYYLKTSPILSSNEQPSGRN